MRWVADIRAFSMDSSVHPSVQDSYPLDFMHNKRIEKHFLTLECPKNRTEPQNSGLAHGVAYAYYVYGLDVRSTRRLSKIARAWPFGDASEKPYWFVISSAGIVNT